MTRDEMIAILARLGVAEAATMSDDALKAKLAEAVNTAGDPASVTDPAPDPASGAGTADFDRSSPPGWPRRWPLSPPR